MRPTSLAFAIISILTFSAPASAQQAPAKLQVGRWTGTITPPGSETANISYDVSYAGDTLKISIDAGDHGKFETTGAAFEPGKISFSFAPGPVVICVLRQKDSDYVGACTEDSGEAGDISMSPPKKPE